jgi:hypothetical protein
MDDDIKMVLLSVVCAVLLIVGLFAIGLINEPTCPAGSIATLTRGGWYCTVPSLHR